MESEPALAVTVNMCAPGAMPVYVAGVEHGAGAPASIAQASADAFVAETENEAEVDVVVAPGPERIVTVGGGVVAGGAELTWEGVDIFPFRDGKILRKDVYSNASRRVPEQLGTS